jgi:hypothetical protein
MLNRSFDDTIVMQIVYPPEPRKQESALLIASQSRLGLTTPATVQLRSSVGQVSTRVETRGFLGLFGESESKLEH